MLYEVENFYNGIGQLTQEYQSVNGAVDTDTTPSVQYGYDTLAHGARMTSMTYPNGTVLYYNYGTSDKEGRKRGHDQSRSA